MMYNRIINLGIRITESHPYIWKLAWDLVHRSHYLLPHDKSYRALRHFIAATPSGLFLDVGANDGISALSFRKFDKDYKILSLEPNFKLEEDLKKIRLTDPHFEYKMVGASSKATRLQFFVQIGRAHV